MPKLVAFDIDGTLVNSWDIFEKEIRKYSEENNMQMPCLQSIKTGYAYANDVDFKWGLKLHEQRKHLHSVFARVDKVDKDIVPPLFDGVLELLTKLKDTGYTLGIVTSKPSAPLHHILEHYGISDMFCAIRTSCDIEGRGEKEKPAPDQLLSITRELEFKPNETIMIGDTTMDIEMGVNAGTNTIGVTWGNHCVDRLNGAGACKISHNNFDELFQHIIERF